MLSSSSRRTVALLVLGVVMAAIFAADTLTDYAVAAACFYAAVILAASRLLSGRGLVRLAALCIGLTGLSFFLTRFGTYRIGLFLYHYAHGRYAEALAEARRINAPSVLYGHVAVAAAAAELGRDDEAAEAIAAIRSLDPSYGPRVATDLESRHVAPELVARLVAGLKKAGLSVVAPVPSKAAS